MNIGHLIATLGVDTAGLVLAERNMKQFETRISASVARINAKLATTGAAMKKFGRGMTMYMTAPLALVGGAAFKMHMDFESSMSKIVGLVGVARTQVDQWSKDILRMAPALGRVPKELADAMFFITSAGIRGANALDVLEKSAKASVSGLGAVKDVADLVTSAMNAYGAATLNAQMATDVLTATVREGKAEAVALATSMGMVLPIASNMAVQFHEVGAAVAAMTRTGTSAQTASMQLRQILASLLKPTQQAEKALWAMKTSSAALRKTIREDGLLAALSKIKDLSEEYGETVMSTVFPNIRALSGVLDIMGANLEDNEKIFASLSKAVGSAEKAFEAAAETTEHKWNVAMSSAKTALTILGGTVSKELIPVLERFSGWIQRLIIWFEGLSEGQRRMIVRVAGLIAVVGPLSMMLGFLATNVLPGLIKMFNFLTIAMLRNPITAVAVGIAALVTVLIGFKKKTDLATDAQTKLNEAWGDAKGLTPSIEELIKTLGDLNLEQVESVRRRIQSEILLEKDFTKLLDKEAVQRFLFRDVEKDKILKRAQASNQKELDLLTGFLAKVENRLKEFRKKTKPGIAGAPTAEFSVIQSSEEFINERDEHFALLRQMMADIEGMEIEKQRNLAKIRDWYRSEEERKENEAEMRKRVIEDAAFASARNVLTTFGNLFEAQKQKELAIVGNNAAAREEIQRKYANREKTIAIGQALINTALAVTKALTAAPPPWNLILAATSAAAGLAQVALIKAQEFAEGGIVTKPTFAILGEKGPEAVIPLNKQAIGGDIYITLEPAFSNEDLYYRVKEVDRKHSNSF